MDFFFSILVHVFDFLVLTLTWLNLLQIADLIRYDGSTSDQTLVYILTLGVVETYRNLGIGRTSLVWRILPESVVI